MIWYILVFFFKWMIRFYKGVEVDKEVRFSFALAYPFSVLGMAFLWNVWARHLIGWPEIDTFKELVVSLMIF